MNPSQIRDLIRTAIENMVREDDKGVPARRLLDSAERNITAHLRDHISRLVSGSYKYQVDHEYNRSGRGKEPKFSAVFEHNVIPDVLVHLRGVTLHDNPDANLLVIEVKKLPNFEGDRVETRKRLLTDLKKLKALTCSQDRYGYKYGASVVFAKESVWIALNASRFDKLLSFPIRT